MILRREPEGTVSPGTTCTVNVADAPTSVDDELNVKLRTVETVAVNVIPFDCVSTCTPPVEYVVNVNVLDGLVV